MSFPIVDDEVALLDRVRARLEEAPPPPPPREHEIVAELVRIRDEVQRSKEEDQGAMMDQYHQLVSLLEQLRSARGAARVDPESPYFAHLRLAEDGRERDVCLGRATHLEGGVRIIDWRNAPISKIYYRYQQGDDYEEEIGGRTRRGEVVARRTLVIRGGRLERIDAPEGVFLHEADGWTHRAHESRLAGGHGAAIRAHSGFVPVVHADGAGRRLGTDLAGDRRRLDKRLPDIAGLLDPAQFTLITRPSTGFLVIRGAAGSGKTTVALHRIAWLAYEHPEVDSQRTLFVVFGNALRDYVSHVLPALGVKNVAVTTWHDWAREALRRHFPQLPRAIREDTPSVVARLKVHPIVAVALEEQIRDTRVPASAEQVLDDWASAMLDAGRLEKIQLEVAPGAFTRAELDRACAWARDRQEELSLWRDGDRSIEAALDEEDVALLLRAWQLRVGPLQRRGGGTVRHRHVAIDEVQDFAPIEVQVLLGTLDEHRSITLAGDTQQHVMQESGFTSWADFFRHLGVEGTVVDTLKISYRCSVEISSFAHALLGELREEAAPPESSRHGPAVELFTFTDAGACVGFLASALEQLLHDEPLASVALLTPNAETSRLYHDGLAACDLPRLRLVEDQAFTFAPGVEVTEVDQVKGLEFDYVVLIDTSAARWPPSPGARRLLHVGATRAVHQLWVTSVGTPSAIVREALDELRAGAASSS